MSGYIGTQPVPQATQTRDAFTATSNQTSFATSGYTPNFLDVYLNGVKLAAADYTASNGSDVVLATGATTGDILEVVAYTTFDTANVTGAANFTVTGSFTSQGIDDNANSTAITIDASENVLVGTTDTDPYTTSTTSGISLDANGRVGASYLDSAPMILNRRSSDGTIAQFRKDGSTVGSIGNTGSRLYLGSGNVGAGFQSDTDKRFYPVDPSNGGGGQDAYIDLGRNNVRWKDLYLSGGVYLGGTGSANKLDDYEEGTWTPVLAGGTTAGSQTYFGAYTQGRYVKVGNIVMVSGIINLTAFDSATNGGMTITGLPFTASSGTNNSTAGFLANYKEVAAGASLQLGLSLPNAQSKLDIKASNSSGAGITSVTHSAFSAYSGLNFSVTYPAA